MTQTFNIVIVGTGGQGLITLLQILAEAALLEGFDVRTSELHGLSQRGGSVEVHIRFGKKIHSPLVAQGKADLILGLEIQECLKARQFANPKTKFLINDCIVPIPEQRSVSKIKILQALKSWTKHISIVPAVEICEKELGNKVVAGVYLLSLAAFKNLIPIEPNSILQGIKKIVPQKYLELNKKTFELAKAHEL